MFTVQEKIRILLWDRRYLIVPQDIPAPEGVQAVIMKYPSITDWNYFLFVRRLEEHQNLLSGVPTEENVFKSAREAGYWTDEDVRVEKESAEYIEMLEGEIQNQKFASRKKILERQLTETRKLRSDVLSKANYLKTQTAEYLAHEVSVFSILIKTVLTVDGQPLWKSEEDFLKDKKEYIEFIAFLAHHFVTESVWETKDLREIARSAEWRLVWCLNRENLASLFNIPPADLNLNQRLLVYWSRVYDIGFEDPQRPETEIFESDDKYDGWLASRDQNMKEKKVNDKVKNSSHHHEQGAILDGEFIETCVCGVGPQKRVGLGMKQPHIAPCQYGEFRKYSEAEKIAISKEIYGRNSKQIRRHLNAEHDAVDKHGTVEEHHLRGKKSRMLLGQQSKLFKKKR